MPGNERAEPSEHPDQDGEGADGQQPDRLRTQTWLVRRRGECQDAADQRGGRDDGPPLWSHGGEYHVQHFKPPAEA